VAGIAACSPHSRLDRVLPCRCLSTALDRTGCIRIQSFRSCWYCRHHYTLLTAVGTDCLEPSRQCTAAVFVRDSHASATACNCRDSRQKQREE